VVDEGHRTRTARDRFDAQGPAPAEEVDDIEVAHAPSEPMMSKMASRTRSEVGRTAGEGSR